MKELSISWKEQTVRIDQHFQFGLSWQSGRNWAYGL